MKKNLYGQPYLKGILFWLVFLLMYFAYKYFPSWPLSVLCAINESNFQHYKASFFAWIIISIPEYFMLRRSMPSLNGFIYSRMATAVILPWFVFILWYLGPAVYGKMPTIPLEILYANIITLIVGVFGNILERGLSGLSWTRELKFMILFLMLASLVLYMVFRFVKLPWADVFIEPDWR